MQLNDTQLYALCKKYGHRARIWRQKFAGLLPEVARRRLYEKKGYGSIFEFAAKLAGMSQDQVRLVLNLERRFDDKPLLKNMLEQGEVSVNKLARVASVVSGANEEFWASQAKLLPSRALETLVRDEKAAASSECDVEDENGLLPPQNSTKSLHVQPAEASELGLSPEVTKKLRELKLKGIDISALLMEFLQEREQEIVREKDRLAQESEQAARERILIEHKQPSRHIPIEIQHLLKQEFGEKCSVPSCMRESQTIHHTQRFALSQNHNPYFLAPLCEEHHAIAHSIDVNIYAHKTEKAPSR